MKYIRRAMEDTFTKLSKQFPAILITGPRQVGKTTMLKKLMKDENIGRTYVTLDDLAERQIAKNDPALFFSFINLRCLLTKYNMHRSFFRI